MFTRGSFTRDDWNHLLCLFNINHFCSINSVKAMSTILFVCWISRISRCFLFFFKQKAECHVQESSGKYFLGRFGSDEIKTDEFDVKELLERKEKITRKVLLIQTAQELDQSYVSPSVRKLTLNVNQSPTHVFSRETRRWHSIFEHEETGWKRWIFKLSPCQEIGARWEDRNWKI